MNKAKNMTTGTGYLLRREDYKRVKKMDRQQFESFCKNLYMTAYEEGRSRFLGLMYQRLKQQLVKRKELGRTD